MNNVIEVNGLKKSYGSHIVLKGISFNIARGEIFALLGANGAGKTTALECIQGLRKYDSGTIIVNGKAGIQLQSSSLPVHIKPMEALQLFARWNKTSVPGHVIDTFGISEIKNKQYAQLSTGQKRRLHLALALTGRPDIVFLDEPSAGLDPEGKILLHKQIRHLKEKGKTIVLASHDMAEVEALCDKIAVLNNGNIVFYGTVQELAVKTGKKYVIHITTKEGTDTYETEDIGSTLFSELASLNQQGAVILDIKAGKGTLEQNFIEIAGRTGK